MSGLADALMSFVRTDLLKGRDLAVDHDTQLFDEGLVDSLGILRLIAFLEVRIGRPIADSEIAIDAKSSFLRRLNAIVHPPRRGW